METERTERSIHRTALWHDNQADRKTRKKGLDAEVARHRRIAQVLRDELRTEGWEQGPWR